MVHEVGTRVRAVLEVEIENVVSIESEHCTEVACEYCRVDVSDISLLNEFLENLPS